MSTKMVLVKMLKHEYKNSVSQNVKTRVQK